MKTKTDRCANTWRYSPTDTVSCLLVCLCLVSSPGLATPMETLSGRDIMEESYRRHEQFPYVYEEQVMILVDSTGERNTRKLRRYSRMDTKALAKYLLVFDAPPEIRGVGLLTSRRPSGVSDTSVYLPAYGPQLISSLIQKDSGSFLGTDFSVGDLLPEALDDFVYDRKDNEFSDNVGYFVVDVHTKAEDSVTALRRHYIRHDNFYITRTDIFDAHGRLHKQLTHHDLKHLGGAMWRANMIRMVDHKLKHQSLIKIEQRVFSRDYVPNTIFTLEWLVNNRSPSEKQPDDADSSHDNSAPTSETHNHDITLNTPGAR